MKKTDLANVTEEGFNIACNRFRSFKGIISSKTSTYESFLKIYRSFLKTCLGYIYSKCSGKTNVSSEDIYLVSNIANLINSIVKVDSALAQRELNAINKILSEKENIMVSEDVLASKISVNFDSLVDGFLSSPIFAKYRYINYILNQEGIVDNTKETTIDDIEETTIVSTDVDLRVVRAFTDYLALSKNIICLKAEDILDALCEIVSAEIASLSSQTEYTNKYPSLTKALLLRTSREEFAELKKESYDDPVFSFCLGQLLSKLSQYDKMFLNGINVSMPYSKLRDRFYKAFSKGAFKYKIALKVNPYMHESQQALAITPKELLACVPNDFYKKMKESYSKDGENTYAENLSLVIFKYCVSENGKRYGYDSIRQALDTKFCQFSGNTK